MGMEDGSFDFGGMGDGGMGGMDLMNPQVQQQLMAMSQNPQVLAQLAQKADPHQIMAVLDAQSGSTVPVSSPGTPNANPVPPTLGAPVPGATSDTGVDPVTGQPKPRNYAPIGQALTGAVNLAGIRPQIPQPIHPGQAPVAGHASLAPRPGMGVLPLNQTQPYPVGRLLLGR